MVKRNRSKESHHARTEHQVNSGDGVALFTAAYVEAAIAFRARGYGMLRQAQNPPMAGSTFREDVAAARSALRGLAKALIRSADAIDRAIRMPADSAVAVLDFEQLETAIVCFRRCREQEAETHRIFGEAASRATFYRVRPSGHA